MYQIFFSIGQVLERSFTVLVILGWLPVIGISLILTFGLIYWLIVQNRFTKEARRRGTMI